MTLIASLALPPNAPDAFHLARAAACAETEKVTNAAIKGIIRKPRSEPMYWESSI